MNHSQFNVLQTIFVKKEFEEMCDNEINTLENITNEKYDQVRNVYHVIRKDLKKLKLKRNSISKKEINQF